jgi:hypothetical protein
VLAKRTAKSLQIDYTDTRKITSGSDTKNLPQHSLVADPGADKQRPIRINLKAVELADRQDFGYSRGTVQWNGTVPCLYWLYRTCERFEMAGGARRRNKPGPSLWC